MLYLSKLKSKLDEALSKETRESLTEWIGNKRKKPLNQNKMTAVEWLEEKVDNMILNGGDTDLLAVIEHIKQAKEMHKDEIENFAEWFKESEWSCFDNTERGNVYANSLITDELLTVGEIYELYLKLKS